ncbi:MAG: ABC transporter substrate-binding protein [Phycisphaerae bacterium]
MYTRLTCESPRVATRGLLDVLPGCLLLSLCGLCHAVEPDVKPGPPPQVQQVWRTFTTEDGLPHNNVRTISVSGEQVWVGTEGGLALRQGDRWRSWTQREGLPWPVITAIDVDTSTREVWLGTWGGGLVRFSGGRFDKFDQRNSGLAGDLVFAVVVRDGCVWAATIGGVSKFDPVADTWDLHFERRTDQPESVITHLCIDPGNRDYLYAAQWCGDVWRLDMRGRERGTKGRRDEGTKGNAHSSLHTGGEWTPVEGTGGGRVGDPSPKSQRGESGSGEATLAIAAGGRSLWWLTLDGLLRRDLSGNWEARNTAERMTRADLVYCLAAPNDSQAWLGTDRGLRVLVDWATDTWVTYERDEGTEGRRDEGESAIRGAQSSIVNRQSSIPNPQSAIPDNRVRCVAFQGDDVWVGTTAGLALGTGWSGWSSFRSADGEGGTKGRREEGTKVWVREGILAPASIANPQSAIRNPQAVPIAVLAPITQTITLPGVGPAKSDRKSVADRLAVRLAVEQANAQGGYRNRIPFELATNPKGWERYGWGAPEDDLAVYVVQDQVWGFVGHLAPDSKIMSVAVLHTQVPVVNTAGAPATIDEVINPWIFRPLGAHFKRHRAVLDYIFDSLGQTRAAVIHTPGRLSKTHLAYWAAYARHRGYPLVAEVDYAPNPSVPSSFDQQLATLRDSAAQVVLTWCDAPTSAAIVKLLREAQMEQVFVGSASLVGEEFIGLAGPQPGPVFSAYPCWASRGTEGREEGTKLRATEEGARRRHKGTKGNPQSAIRNPQSGSSIARFMESYMAQNPAERSQQSPGREAFSSFNAANLLLEAINIAGLDRREIQRTLARMSDALFAHLQEGTWKFYTQQDLRP